MHMVHDTRGFYTWLWLDGIPQKEVIEEDWKRELLRRSSARALRWFQIEPSGSGDENDRDLGLKIAPFVWYSIMLSSCSLFFSFLSYNQGVLIEVQDVH